jgi:hypothetical protein
MMNDQIRNIVQNNKIKIKEEWKEQIRTFESCVEKQHNIILDYCLSVNFAYKIDNYPILKGIIYKNTINMHSALELIKMGYHSSAAILLRNVFEGFLIIIQAERYKDQKLYKKFRRNRTIEPYSSIQENSKIPVRVKKEFKILWDFLCKKNHATTSTMQVSIDYDAQIKGYQSNKELTSEILGIYVLFLDINWVLSENYIFDPFCRIIIEEKYREMNDFNKFKYKYNKTNELSKFYRNEYSSQTNVIVEYIEQYTSTVELNMIT